MSTVISVEEVSKAYRLGMIGGATFKEDFVRWWAKLRGKPDPLAKVGHHEPQNRRIGEEFWALKDVSFKVQEGEVVGIIGRNGAGKSTLLKILSQVTSPDSGEIKIKGRIASLLEVGTGFHPELTGRENIFLNAAILGMTKSEVRAKFDEIVAFSGVEEFIDTPVKRYSSGMYVRLAFAVAAHLEPEILIVDEVLAVGDIQFQKKCLGKMQEVSREQGRTVLFVSHNLAAVKTLCQKGVFLDDGRLAYWGPVRNAIDRYLCGTEEQLFNGVISDSYPRQYSTGEATIRRVQLINESNHRLGSIDTGDSMDIVVEYEVKRALDAAFLEIGIMDSEGRQITQSFSWDGGRRFYRMLPGKYEIRLHLDLAIFPARYSLLAAIHKEDGTTVDSIERALDFEVLNTAREDPNHHRWEVRGYLRPDDRWEGPYLTETVSTTIDDRK